MLMRVKASESISDIIRNAVAVESVGADYGGLVDKSRLPPANRELSFVDRQRYFLIGRFNLNNCYKLRVENRRRYT